jgi:Tol biopolymer transport system component
MSLTPGSRLGPYEIAALLGVGGMGEVYSARDTRLRREVAIKVLPEADGSDLDRLARFAREAEILASLNHPNIAQVYGLEESGGVRALVLEMVSGETLAERLERGAMPLAEVLNVARQVCDALDAAHEQGIIHRDLKPANIKITPAHTVKVLDFGLAKVLEPASPSVRRSPASPAVAAGSADAPTVVSPGVTRTGFIVGTPSYMSPEQARGQAVDKRADVWAFGCLLYAMLTGRDAFGGGTLVETLAAVLKEEPRWDALPLATPARLRRLLARCLEKDPRRRQRDVGDVRPELEDLAAGDPVARDAVGCDPEATAAAGVPARSSATLAWSVAGGTVLLAISALVVSGLHAPAPRAEMRFSAVTSFAGVESQPALAPDGRSVAFVSNRDGQWDIYVGLVAGGSLVRVTNDPNLETRPRWSPDGARLLFSRLNETGLNDAWVVSALGGTERRIVLNALYPAWSPDGRAIAYTARGSIWICDANGERPRAVTTHEPLLVHVQPAFSHRGGELAFVRRGAGPYGELAVADLATGAVRPVTQDGALAWSPVWSSDDRAIYFTSTRGGTMNIWKIPVVSGEPEQITAGQGADSDIDLSTDGTRLVFSSFRVNLDLAELSLEPGSLGRSRWLTKDATRGEVAPRYSPDGGKIAYFAHRAGAERESIWVMDADGSNPSQLVADSYGNTFPRWAGDGQELLFSSRAGQAIGGFELRRIAVVGGAPQTLAVKPARSQWGDVAADGRLVYQTSASAGEVYDPRTHQTQQVPDLPSEPSWSRDGQSFAYIVRPDPDKPADAGLWVGTPAGARRQLFRGWAVSFAWAGPGEVMVLEGKPDLQGVLWRVDAAGGRSVVLSGVGLYRRATDPAETPIRFDAHPDGRRVVIESVDVLESDLGLIDKVR